MNSADNIHINISGPKPNQNLSLTLNWDANLEQWVDVFKTILINQTFPLDVVKDLFESHDSNN